MEYASTPMTPPASKTVVLQPAPGPVPANPPTDLTHADVAVWLLLALIVFMAPTWIAARGRRLSIGLINVLLGWTLFGWVLALVMAVRSQENAK